MSALTLRLRDPDHGTIHAKGITPSAFRNLSVQQISHVAVRVGARDIKLGDVFDISGSDSSQIRLQCGREGRTLTDVGASLAGGSLHVEGDTGIRTGRDMTAGSLTVSGCAGDYLGTGLRGGCIDVMGDAGDFVAGALPGYRYGQTGGHLTVRGNVGHRVADRMRRGSLLILGNAGDWAAARLIAGSVWIHGQYGEGLASGMRRGTLVVSSEPSGNAGRQFVDGGPLSPVFSRVFRNAMQLQPGGECLPSPDARVVCLRLVGDRLVNGQGELLVMQVA